MKTFPNECSQCGKPNPQGGMCLSCRQAAQFQGQVYCISGHGKRDLAGLIVEKRKAGLARRGRALPIGGGVLVQMMVVKNSG